MSRSYPSPVNTESHDGITEIVKLWVACFIGEHINECLARFRLSCGMLLGVLFDRKLNSVRTTSCHGECISRSFLCPCGACKKQSNNEGSLNHSFTLWSLEKGASSLNQLSIPVERTAKLLAIGRTC